MRTIGGELEIQPASLGATPVRGPRTPASGRGALFQIVRHAARERGVTRVAIPDYVCESVVQAIEAAGLAVAFYRVGGDLRPVGDSLRAALGPSTAVVLIAYFGLIDVTPDIALVRAASPASVVIKDDVHASFDVNDLRGADYAFTSLRKALPVPDGAPVTPAFPMDLDDEPAARFATARLAAGFAAYVRRYEPLEDAVYSALFNAGEELLDDGSSYRAKMSWMAAAALASLDLDAVAARRRANFRTLEAAIAPLGLRPLAPLDPLDPSAGRAFVPLFLPVRIKDRDVVRRALMKERIFCPAHWPMPRGHAPLETARPLYESELSLVIDQRYDEDDMRRLAAALGRAGAEPLA